MQHPDVTRLRGELSSLVQLITAGEAEVKGEDGALALQNIRKNGEAASGQLLPMELTSDGETGTAASFSVVSAQAGWGLSALVQTIVERLANVASDGQQQSDETACGSSASTSECTAVVIETSRVRGVGSAITAVIRHGCLRTTDWFVVGHACGKVRNMWHLQCNEALPVQAAMAGWSVRVSVAWAHEKELYAHFEVASIAVDISPMKSQTARWPELDSIRQSPPHSPSHFLLEFFTRAQRQRKLANAADQ